MNRKKIGLFAFLAAVAGCSLFAQVTIDAAISSAARDFSQRVPRGARVAVLNIASEHATLTDYIINELIFHMVREGALSVVSRGEVEMQAGLMKLQFQMTDFVTAEDQRHLGEFLAVHTLYHRIGHQGRRGQLPPGFKRRSPGDLCVSGRLRNVRSN